MMFLPLIVGMCGWSEFREEPPNLRLRTDKLNYRRGSRRIFISLKNDGATRVRFDPGWRIRVGRLDALDRTPRDRINQVPGARVWGTDPAEASVEIRSRPETTTQTYIWWVWNAETKPSGSYYVEFKDRDGRRIANRRYFVITRDGKIAGDSRFPLETGNEWFFRGPRGDLEALRVISRSYEEGYVVEDFSGVLRHVPTSLWNDLRVLVDSIFPPPYGRGSRYGRRRFELSTKMGAFGNCVEVLSWDFTPSGQDSWSEFAITFAGSTGPVRCLRGYPAEAYDLEFAKLETSTKIHRIGNVYDSYAPYVSPPVTGTTP